MIIETCPECGANIESLVICTYPPITIRRCTKCGWKWEEKPEEIKYVPFNPDGYYCALK